MAAKTQARRPRTPRSAPKPASARIDAGAIDLLGNARAARKLSAFALQEGAASLALLEQAFTAGSKPIRAAAAAALAHVDKARGEALAREALERVLNQKRPQRRELRARLADLVVQRTPFALERALEIMLERGIGVHGLDDGTQRILVGALVERVGARSLDDAAALLEATEGIEVARPFLVNVLDDDKRPLRDRREAAAALAALGDATSMAALLARASASSSSLPRKGSASASANVHVVPDLVLRVLLRGDPAAAFDKLADVFRSDAPARGTIADEITPRADKRWLGLAQDMIDVDASRALLVLARAGGVERVVAIASRSTLDVVVRHALHALAAVHDRRAVPLLLGWLEGDDGEAHAPTLLSALGECASLEDIARIEAIAVSPGHVSFIDACVERVRHRASSIT